MKKIFFIPVFMGLTMTACHDLTLNPLSSGSSANWYQTTKEVEMAVNDLYNQDYWTTDESEATFYGGVSDWSDDNVYRNALSDFQSGTVNGQNKYVVALWKNEYRAIAHVNAILEKTVLDNFDAASRPAVERLLAEAHFHRAVAYSKLVTKFGEVPLVEKDMDISKAFEMERADKQTLINFIYDEFDKAITVLPVSSTGTQRITKGAALGMKARFALYMSDYPIVETCTKAVIDLGVYKLHDNYRNLFLPSTHNSKEMVFGLPRSIELGVSIPTLYFLPRTAGGYGAPNPTWDLLAAYLCTDGQTIDKSPLFDPHDPFKNRDPRLSMNIVPFGERFVGFEYNPHPEALEIMDYKNNKKVKNNDNRAVAQYASFTALIWKKGYDDEALANGKKIAPDLLVLRYADILLMYAEAKIEQNKIDDSVRDAINQVRARAYRVDKSQTSQYPAVTATSQTELRKILRIERRMEFPKEGLRYMDLMRWKLIDKVMSKKVYGILYPASTLIEKVVNTDSWFWPFAPDIDENGLADFTKMEATGKINVLSEKKWDARQYVWPIPTVEIETNPDHIKQNPDY